MPIETEATERKVLAVQLENMHSMIQEMRSDMKEFVKEMNAKFEKLEGFRNWFMGGFGVVSFLLVIIYGIFLARNGDLKAVESRTSELSAQQKVTEQRIIALERATQTTSSLANSAALKSLSKDTP